MKETKSGHTIGIFSGLQISMGLVVLCIIAMITLLWKYPYESSGSTGNPNHSSRSSENQQGSNTTQGSQNGSYGNAIDLTSQPYSSDEDIVVTIRRLENQSNQQLKERQQRNIDPSFSPQSILPRYFKTFNGDNYIMRK